MAHVLLLHGSLMGPWAWEPVAERLRAAGHRTTAPDLPYHDPAARWDEHLDVIAEALAGAAPDAVVAHSAGGLLAPAVAAGARITYVAALMADAHRSLYDQWEDEPDLFAPGWVTFGAPPAWEDEARARHFLLHDCPADVAGHVLSRLRPDHGGLARTPAPVSAVGPALAVIPTEDRTIQPAWMRRTAGLLGMDIAELHAGHLPQLSQPDAIADLVLAGLMAAA